MGVWRWEAACGACVGVVVVDLCPIYITANCHVSSVGGQPPLWLALVLPVFNFLWSFVLRSLKIRCLAVGRTKQVVPWHFFCNGYRCWEALWPHVGVFLPSGGSKFRFPTDFRTERASGGMPSCRCCNSGCLVLVRCITRPSMIVSPSTILIRISYET